MFGKRSGMPETISSKKGKVFPKRNFCETLPNQGSVRHMEVVFLSSGKKVVLAGGLGPLQSLALAGAMTFQLSPAGEGAKLEVTYAVTGYLAGGMNALATLDGAFFQVMSAQIPEAA
jgi:hypothetical protein